MDQAEALAKLKAHGDMFLASLGIDVEEEGEGEGEDRPSDQSEEELVISDDDDDDDDEEDEEDDGDFTFEQSDDDEDLLATALSKSRRTPTPPPKNVIPKNVVPVTVFADPTKDRLRSGPSKQEYKAFMSSKIGKKPPPPPSATSFEDEQDDRENTALDRELETLLKSNGSSLHALTSNPSALVQLVTEQALTGREKRKHIDHKLLALGIKDDKKQSIPLKMHLGLRKAVVDRGKQRLTDARDAGMYTDALRREVEEETGAAKRPDAYRKDRGMRMAVGKYKDGALVISEKEIRRVESQGKRKSPHPSGGGGGSKKAKSKKASKFKRRK